MGGKSKRRKVLQQSKHQRKRAILRVLHNSQYGRKQEHLIQAGLVERVEVERRC